MRRLWVVPQFGFAFGAIALAVLLPFERAVLLELLCIAASIACWALRGPL